MAQTIYIQATDDLTGAPLPGVSIAFVPDVGSPELPGGVTGADGKFQKDFWFFWPENINSFRYTVRGTKEGYAVRDVTVLATRGQSSHPILNMQVADLSGVTLSGIPQLVSVGNPPTLRFSGLPYHDYAYVETLVDGDGDSTTIETAVKPNGTCAVCLTECFRIEPFPSLVADASTALLDTYLSRDYIITATLVTGGVRRLIARFATTALLIDHPDPALLFYKWLCGDHITVTRGAYCDVMMLLPEGAYAISRRLGGMWQLSEIPVTSDGKTPIRVRIPDVSAEYSTLTIQAMQNNLPATPTLTVSFRE